MCVLLVFPFLKLAHFPFQALEQNRTTKREISRKAAQFLFCCLSHQSSCHSIIWLFFLKKTLKMGILENRRVPKDDTLFHK